jgi:8-oxo-dGTP pyrophosphatase MutT (NUDIX family)
MASSISRISPRACSQSRITSSTWSGSIAIRWDDIREIPEGGCGEGEDPLDAAQRELEEETGLRAKNWRKLGESHLSNSVSDELAIWYVATELTLGERRPEGTEQLEVRRVPFVEALRMTLSGEITDSVSQLAIMQFGLLT